LIVLRELEYTEAVDLKVFCGTWNVNAKKIENDENLMSWLCPDGQFVDFYVIGFQEIVDLTAVNVAVESKSQKQTLYWKEQIENCFEIRSGSYRQVATKYLVGLLLFVYAREDVSKFIRDVRCTTAGVGVMGVMGNKGAVCVHLYLYDTSICLVCAHLAAHQSNVSGRNSDYQNIVEKTLFSLDTIVYSGSQLNSAEMTKVGFGTVDASETSIIDHDITFWIGDLNYRIDVTDSGFSLDDIYERIEGKDFNSLLEHDQLLIERKAERVLQGFHEAPITFEPTYKYIAGK